jgi:hypothetical protein
VSSDGCGARTAPDPAADAYGREEGTRRCASDAADAADAAESPDAADAAEAPAESGAPAPTVLVERVALPSAAAELVAETAPEAAAAPEPATRRT